MMTPQPSEAAVPDREIEQPTLASRLDCLTRVVRRLFRVPMVLVSLVHDGELRLHAGQGVPASLLGAQVPFDAATLAANGPLLIADTLADERFRHHPWVTGRPQVRFYAGTRVMGTDGKVVGVLAVCDRIPQALADADLLMLRDVATFVQSELRAVALGHTQEVLAAESEKLRRRALVDTGTQLWNRSAMFALLDREFHRARREREGVAVILGEIDEFEELLKQHGASAGASVLQEVTHRIRAVVRRSDTVARFGPDEFLVFLGRCDLENATALAERMRQRIRKTPIAAGAAHIQVSMTFGVAAGDGHTEWTPDSLVRRADEALGLAVNAGRDCVAGRQV